MIAMLFYLLCGFAVIHVIYERIVQPSIRLHYRNRLFAIRDEVRNQIIEGLNEHDAKVANVVHHGLNNTINRLHLLTLGNKIRAQKRFEEDEQMRQRVEENVSLIVKCDNEIILNALNKTVEIADKVLLFNNLMFFIYTLPLVLLFWMSSGVLTVCKKFFKLYKKRLVSKEFEKSIIFMNDRFVDRAVVSS
ncbi:TPA: hypothetical protein N2R22_002997 [Klebsiella pneumoniae]|uniref:hypothetical protein n=1 Tax=Klebsiella quasipneumoniae TaxID=1463165 RepID=UPI003A9CAB15|nr:hypothetical protein [Klebsiella quasipneumoniae subsp. quasipneumoniae]HCL6602505.1 hypothetical protein [Klebsiella pneumoniae]